MQKNYILDTNVLIHDPESIYQFQDNNLYIPIYVLEELDRLKSEPSLRGKNSREVCRLIDELRCQGSLPEGIKLQNDGMIFIYVPKERKKISVALDYNSMDNAILQCALEIQDNNNTKSILVTMDVNLRIRAESLGIQTAAYESQAVDINSLDNKVKEIIVTKKDIDLFYSQGFLEINDDLAINSSIVLKDNVNSSAIGRVKYYGNNKSICKLKIPNNILGLKPRNVEQQFAIDLLLDDDIKFITLMGTAGSGKSILSLTASLYKIFEEKVYNKLLVSRPVIPMGKDIGYLPGDSNDKLRPFMQPIYDNIDYILISSGSRRKYNIESCQSLFDNNIIEIEPLVYIRGRSIINQIMMIDEVQSLTQHEIKTIISRCGENTKIIFTGDIEQIDNPYVNKESNGLTAAVKNIKNNPIVGHILLEKGERSELANLAVNNL